MDHTLELVDQHRAAMEALRLHIEATITELPEAPEAAVAALRESPLGAKVLAAGFGGKLDETARVSFGEFCVDSDRVDVLRAVIAAAPHGVDYRTTCCADYQVGSDVWSGWRRSLHAHAVRRSSPEALRLALELDPAEESLTRHIQLLGGTLHANALARVFSAEDVEAAAEVCRILLAIKAPMFEQRPGESAPEAMASSIFFEGEDWSWRTDAARELLADYIAAGLVDLNVACVGLTDSGNLDGMFPLRAAMVQGNIAGAVACIDLGCDIEAAVASGSIRQSTGAKDLISLAKSLALETAEEEARLVASLTKAVMRRALRESGATANSQPEAQPEARPHPQPESPRRRRAPGV